MSVKIDRRGLDKLVKNAEKLHGENTFTLGEALNDEFISSNSSYSSLEEMIESSGFVVKTLEEFAAIPDNEWETFIVNNTSFESWESMQIRAHEELIHKRLMKGL
ncbi:MAG: hypothetical protein ACJAVX_003320 [Pseudoalteromonas rhizosphaerae]|jgi:hypothetical protein|uniref:hypothetical protein n=1 Tax=Pseudoalteromonas rhizosphaerae TaxID=2518973 RepID=UPI0039E394F1